GRLKLRTRPSCTGSVAVVKTMGIVVLAALAASAAGVLPGVAITATCRRTRSDANAGNRSFWFSAQRYSIATFSPSTWPVPPRPWRKERSRVRGTASSDYLGSRNPIPGIAACCARAVSGHAATVPQPSRMTKSRRRIPDTRASPLAVGPPHPQPTTNLVAGPWGGPELYGIRGGAPWLQAADGEGAMEGGVRTPCQPVR